MNQTNMAAKLLEYNDQGNMAAKVLEYNKAFFEGTYNTMIFWQDQTEKAMDTFLDRSNLLAKEMKKFTDEWTRVYKAGRESFKSSADEAFKKVEVFLAGSRND